MIVMQKRIVYYLLGIILAVTAISQAVKGNYLLSLFPCIGSVAFFVQAWRMNKS